MARFEKLIAGLSSWVLSSLVVVHAASISDLRCENLTDPGGIDVAQPRLSWVIHSSSHNEQQTAYQILVASSAAKLAADAGDLWDTGKVPSDQSIQVNYQGTLLTA